jgi:ribosome-associated protein
MTLAATPGRNIAASAASARRSDKSAEEFAEAKRLAARAAALAVDKKGIDVVVLDVRGKTSYTDYIVIASADSERQVTAMAEHIEETLHQEGHRLFGTEGLGAGHWALLDYGEVVIHLFFSDARAFYDLDGLWADAAREHFS